MINKIAKIKELFKQIDPKAELEVVKHDDGTHTVCGPFPSFMLLISEDGPIRSLIHVNADAPNMVYIFGVFNKELDIEQDGAFAIVGETGELLFNMEAYNKKEDNILMFAEEIKKRRPAQVKNEGVYVPEAKKIILS